MGDLSVTVRMNGTVVEDRVLAVHRIVRIGEAPRAAVAFPGADIAVVRLGERLALRGRTLEEGEDMHLSLGAIEVTVEHTMRARFPSEWKNLMDWRLLAAAALVTAVGSWMDAAVDWADRRAEISSGGAIAWVPASPEEANQVVATVSPAREEAVVISELPDEPLDGPRHLPDDESTGIGWFAWYQRALPTDDRVEEAYERFATDDTDVAARRVLARAAYDREAYDEAVWHYGWLIQRDPEDRGARLRLAWSLRRMGRHRAEAELYRSILEDHPNDPGALGGLATALARVGRLDEATALVDRLQAVAPMSPETDLTIGILAAMQGLDSAAISELERALVNREQLPEELQIELRRDIALDPALARLRADKRLLAVFHRHLAAAAPRPVR